MSAQEVAASGQKLSRRERADALVAARRGAAASTHKFTDDEVLGRLREDARTRYLLAMADDELVIGHRHSHWTGVAPSLEEDLAFATIAQDEINHADVWYQIVVADLGVTPGGEDERDAVDAVGLGRLPEAYRHAVLCERPPGDFAYTLARQLLYDRFDALRLEALAASSDAQVGAVARKLRHEERYHLEHAHTWVERLLTGGDEARRRLAEALRAAFADAPGLFEPVPGEDELVASGVVGRTSADLAGPWLTELRPLLDDAGCGDLATVDLAAALTQPGGRNGVHSPDWTDDAWPEMTAMHREHPGARW